jgi:hypothetical protein
MLLPGRRAAGRRTAVATLLLSAPLRDWRAARPKLDPLRYSVARIADDIAYGAGVIAGSVRAGTGEPLRPLVMRTPLRTAPTPAPATAPEDAHG